MLRVHVHSSLLTIEPTEWSRLGDPNFPFTQYQFLAALETTGCLNQRTGWYPRYVTVWDEVGLAGVVILFLKSNSYGEYIFDFAWADAYQRSGLEYFPKLTSAIPFTPATGAKLLLREGAGSSVAEELFDAVNALAEKLQVSSLHALFIPETQRDVYAKDGYFLRDSFQFHWKNQNYNSFADFLGTMKGKRRREILRERAQVAAAPVKISRLTGAQIIDQHADAFYEFYLSTIDKRSSFDYLTQAFFKSVFKEMKEQLLLVLANNTEGKPVAGALNYFSDTTLYGRNWGCLAEYKSLHFELCYYQGIEFAIERGLKFFEAGAQGEHKLQRGFLPTKTLSAHKIFHPVFDRAIQDHVNHERLEVDAAIGVYQSHSPFRS